MRADRIECLADGRYAILDYKTGAPPTEKQVRTGLSPQLTLEAAILRQGGFKNISGASVAELVYVRLRGGANAGEELPVKFTGGQPRQHADNALARLTTLVASSPTPPLPTIRFSTRCGRPYGYLRPSGSRSGVVAGPAPPTRRDGE